MKRSIINEQLVSDIARLMPEMSNSEIATQLNVSVSTVKKVIRENMLKRGSSEEQHIRSQGRIRLIKSERRRALFGLEQHTCLKVFTNRERNILKNCLKRKQYIFLKRGDVIAYFDENTARDDSYEERGTKLGLKFKKLDKTESTLFKPKRI